MYTVMAVPLKKNSAVDRERGPRLEAGNKFTAQLQNIIVIGAWVRLTPYTNKIYGSQLVLQQWWVWYPRLPHAVIALLMFAVTNRTCVGETAVA